VRRARSTAAALAVLTGLGLAACDGSGDAPADRPVTVSGDAASCPGTVVDVVVSVSQWSDLAHRLGGDCASVTTVLASAAADPHDFEPRPGDIAAFEDADLVVLNGAHYDGWAEDAVANLDDEPAVVSTAAIAGADDGADPHLWYQPDLLPRMAEAITAELTELAPEDADVFTAAAAAWQEDLQPYLDELAALQGTAAGRTYAATETVFDRTAGALGLRDVTPEGYRRAASNDSDPAPGDIAAFEGALSAGEVDVLVFNVQTEGSVPDQLRAAAEDAGVPVVEVTESPPDAGGSFVSWQLAQLRQLSTALTSR
jgi:zinc/manganese transport system substrate-binding protein